MFGLALALMIGIVRADEGFDARPPGPALAAAWDATVLLYYWTPTEIGVGSAVVIRTGPGWVDLLTANHVVANECPRGSCANVNVLRNVDFDFNQPPRSFAKPIARDGQILARDEIKDLAVLRIATDEIFTPARMAATCTEQKAAVAAIGFPVTSDRSDVLNIERPDRVMKRWSQGHVINRASRRADGEVIMLSSLPGAEPMLITSADAMEGSSGGPLLNEFGSIVGIVIKTGDGRVDQAYVGRNERPSRQANAMAVPCESIAAFLRGLTP